MSFFNASIARLRFLAPFIFALAVFLSGIAFLAITPAYAASASCQPWQGDVAPSGTTAPPRAGVLLQSTWGPAGTNWASYGTPLTLADCSAACAAESKSLGQSLGCQYDQEEYGYGWWSPSLGYGGGGYDNFYDYCAYVAPSTSLAPSPYWRTCVGDCTIPPGPTGSATLQSHQSDGALCTYTPDPVPVPDPLASLSANPTSVNQGNASTLTWSSQNATSCTGTNFSTGGATSGSVQVSPSASTNYIVSCVNSVNKSAQAQASVTVTTPPPQCQGPNCNCVQNVGASCTSSPNECNQTNDGKIQCDGSCSAISPSDSTCPVTPPGCQGSDCTPQPPPPGCQGSGCTLNPPDFCPNIPGVQSQIPDGYRYDQSSGCIPNPPAPQVSALLSADPTEIIRGATSLLTWSSQNAVSCTGGNFSASGATSGTKQVTPLQTMIYTLNCNDASGNPGTDSTTVKVDSPSVSVTATPGLIRSGDSATISWSVKAGKVDSCSMQGPGISSNALSGSQTLTITAESTYIFTCDAGAFTPSASATVKVVPSFNEI